MSLRVGVTGLRGHLGGACAALLGDAGHAICDLDGYCRAPDVDSLRRLPERLDWVLHFAARTSIAQSQSDPDGVLRHNLAATQAAVDVATTRRAALLYVSSYVYGQPRYNPVDELHPVAAVNPYMASKLAGERLAQEACDHHGLPCVVVRPFSVYGARRQPGRLVSDLLAAAAEGLPLRINDAEPKRDHLFAADFVALIRAIVERQPIASGVYNAGSGEAHSNLDVAELVRKIAGESRAVQVATQPRPNDVGLCVADLRKTTATFGWRPQWSLERALRELLGAQNKV